MAKEQGQVEQLEPTPVIEDEGWAGYQHFTDPTRLPFNVLTYPSQNCNMPSSDKIVPDLGKQLLGQQFTEDVNIIGNKQKFTTTGGDELEVRVWPSTTSIQVQSQVGTFKIGELIKDNITGALGTLVTTGVVDAFTNNLQLSNMVFSPNDGNHMFNKTDTIVGEESGATATITLDNTQRGDVIEVLYTSPNPQNPFFNIPHWYQITTSLGNPLPRGLHRYSFDQWFDTNSDISQSLNIPRLIWVNGNTQVYSWIGALADIVAVTKVLDTNLTYLSVDTQLMTFSSSSAPGTPFQLGEKVVVTGGTGGNFYITAIQNSGLSLVMVLTNLGSGNNPFPTGATATGQTSGATGIIKATYLKSSLNTWAQLGFYSATDFPISINGISNYTLEAAGGSVIGGYGTPDVNVIPSSPPISVGSIAFAGIRADSVTQPLNGNTIGLTLDFCRQNKNYMYYGNWNSRLLYQSNALNKDDSITINSFNGVRNDLIIPSTSTYNIAPFISHSYKITIISTGTPDQFLVIRDDGITTAGTTISSGPLQIDPSHYPGLTVEFGFTTGHTLGDTWTVLAVPPVTNAWFNFYYSLPVRVPGEGYIFRLPSNFWTMDTQENKMYINNQYGEWGVIDTELSADQTNETVIYSPLKQSGALKVIDPWMTGHMEDDLVFVTLDHSLMDIGRQAFLEEPQDGYLSDAVKFDFLPSTFIGGSITYLNKKLFISSPQQGIMHCMDVAKKYWQPPKYFPEVGILSIVGESLICHSNVRNQSFTMFASPSDNGQNYTVIAQTPYNAYFKLVARKRIPARWDSKLTNNSFIEGYITGNPQLNFTVFEGVNDSIGKTHVVVPVIQNNPTDQASIGESSLATHPLGSDLAIDGNYFNEIYSKFKPVLTYYFVSIRISCVSKNHSYSILAVGVNMAFAPTGNQTLFGDRTVT